MAKFQCIIDCQCAIPRQLMISLNKNQDYAIDCAELQNTN